MLAITAFLALSLAPGEPAPVALAQGDAAPATPTPPAEHRARLAGLVRQTDGTAWVGARVQLLARPIGECEDVGEADLLEVRTDARGQFAAMVLDGWRYTVWADSLTAADDAAMEYRVTDTADECVAGRPLELRERAGLQRRGPLPIAGLASWAARAPLRFRVVANTANVFVGDARLDGDALVLPPLPHATHDLEILGADGVPFGVHRLGPDTTELTLAPPVERTVLVRDTDGSQPLAGAVVAFLLRGREHRLGTTDDRGRLRLQWPATTSRRWLRIAHDGFRRGFPGTHRAADGDAVDFVCDMQPLSAPLRGRLMIDAATPAAGVPIRVACDAARSTGGGSGESIEDTIVIWTDADGNFSVPAEPDSMLHAALPPPVRERLGEHARTVHPLVFLSDGERRPAAKGAPWVLSLDTWRTVTLAVTDADGAPAVTADVLFGTSTKSAGRHDPWWVTDQRGEVDLLLPPATVGLLTIAGDQIGLGELDASKLPPAQRRVVFRAEQPFRLRGRILDEAAQPVARSSLFCSAKQPRFVPRGREPDDSGPASEPGNSEIRPISSTDRMYHCVSLAQRHRDRFRGQGPDFEFVLPAVPWVYFINAYEHAGKRSKQLEIQVNEPAPPLLEITIVEG